LNDFSLTLPMREMKDRAGHGKQSEHDHQQNKDVIDPGELLRSCGRRLP